MPKDFRSHQVKAGKAAKTAATGAKAAAPKPAAAAQAQPKPAEKAEKPKEIGGPKGPEPTRYGDWEIKGRCIDF